MAMDEAMGWASDRENLPFIRFYEMERQAVILSVKDSPRRIKSLNLGNFEVARRLSGGRPLSFDDNIIGFAITVPDRDTRPFKSHIAVQEHFGPLIADAIAKFVDTDANRITVGKFGSVNLNGKPIAGTAQWRVPSHFILYHGVVAVRPWNPEKIDSLMRLSSEDFQELLRLPSLLGGSGKNGALELETIKRKLMEELLYSITKWEFAPVDATQKEEIAAQARKLEAEKYGKDSWVLEERVDQDDGVDFCLLFEDKRPRETFELW